MTKQINEHFFTFFGIEPVIQEWETAVTHEQKSRKVYPDLNHPKNKLKIIDIIEKTDHYITFGNGYVRIGNGLSDFIDDCHDTQFEIEGDTISEALYLYLTRSIKELTSVCKDGKFQEYKDTSYTLERENCCYPDGFDEYLIKIEELKQAIAAEKWKV